MTTPLAAPAPDRVAIVTGGSHGVGRAIVRSLASHGHTVVVNYLHDQRAAEATVDAILADNGVALTVRADVADEMDVERLFAETITAFGGIDIVVHAVACRVTAAPLADVDLDEFDALCRINTRATFMINREAARHLRDGGAIVNLPSLASDGLHAATNAATDTFTAALALELQERDITVNAVSLDPDRPNLPDRVADLVAYLLSDHGHHLTGRLLRVDDPGSAPFGSPADAQLLLPNAAEDQPDIVRRPLGTA
jgi:3-oxoacyl-[acyl-carrier protein] reductase